MLHPVYRDHVRPYCGPWALGALTGAPQHVVRAVVYQAMAEKASGHRKRLPGLITGMYVNETLRALELLDHRWESLHEWGSWEHDAVREKLYGYGYRRAHRPTLLSWCQQFARLNAPGLFLVHCGWHYVSAAFDPSGELWLSDNCQRTPSPVPWRSFRGGKQRMWQVWCVTPGAR